MNTINSETIKILGEGIVKILTTLLSTAVPPLGLVAPIIDTSKELRNCASQSISISFSDIENTCKKIIPDYLTQYIGIVSVATDICLNNIDFLTNTYEAKEYSQRLANNFIKDHGNQYGEEELEQIRKFLPKTLEVAIPALEKNLECNHEFQSKWRILINNRIASIEERQGNYEKTLASYDARISIQEERSQRTSPRISELSDSYLSKWTSSLFLDKNKPLSQVYQLPNYQINDYWDAEDEDEDLNHYDDLDVQLQDTLSNCNNLETRMLVVLGHPGSGKSTLITYLLNNCLFDPTRTIRVYRFSNFEGINWNNDPENIPQLMLNAMGLIKTDLSNSLVVLDGLDEIQMHSNHEEFLNYLYQQWAKAKDVNRFSLVVTCRRNRIDCLEDLQMRYLLLCSLNESQIEKFASAYWEKQVSEFDSKQKNLVEKINNSSRHLRDVLGIPLILYIALALEIDLSKGTGLCDIYEHIFSVKNEKNSIYYRRYDKTHPITSVEAEKIQDFSKEVAKLIWEFNPAEGTIEKEKYEPIARKIAASDEDGLRELLVGQYFMEGKDGCQLLFVHRSMYEYFIALSIFSGIEEMIVSNSVPTMLYKNVPFSSGKCELSTFANIIGLQNLADYPDIQDFLLHMLQQRRLGNPEWWKSFFAEFLSNGLSNAADSRPKGGPVGLNEELNRFYNLIWLTREQLKTHGESAPFFLSDDLCESIYLRIPYTGKKDLKELHLSRIELMGYNFVEAQLHSVNLSEAVLNRADFYEADLEFADLHSAEIEQAIFSFSSLVGSNLRNAKLQDAQFENANLRNADFSGANLSGADFSNADLSCAVFTGATLINADFSNSIIEKTNFDRANLEGSLFNELHIKNSSFEGANFTEASLIKTVVSHATSLKGAIFDSCDLSHSDFRGADLSFAKFENATMYDAYLCGSNLNAANLRGADLSSSNLEKATLVGAQLKNAIADNSNMKFANFENADLRGASLKFTDLTNARIFKTKVASDTLNNVICASNDRSNWKFDESIDFCANDPPRSNNMVTDELMEVDDNVFVDIHRLEAFEKQCLEDYEFYSNSDIF